jgi:hypothetical protein
MIFGFLTWYGQSKYNFAHSPIFHILSNLLNWQKDWALRKSAAPFSAAGA